MPYRTTPEVVLDLSHETIAAIKTALRIGHFLGLVLGLGAATLLDMIVVRFLATRRVTADACQIVEFAARVVSAGLAILWVSGLGFMLHYALFDPAKITNPKVWAKMAIVGMLTLNGVFIHRAVLPLIRRGIGRTLFNGMSTAQRGVLLASGVVSGTSWYVPLILGATPQLNFVVPAWAILAAYSALLAGGISITLGVARIALPVAERRVIAASPAEA
mgnify:CR=1 FL=1